MASTNASKPEGPAVAPDTGKSDFRMAVLALIVSVATGAFTYLQYRVADRARQEVHDDSMKILKISYRPYVSIQGGLEIASPRGSRTAEVALQFTAKGATPAVDVVVRRRCVVSTTSDTQANRELTAPAEAWTKLVTAKAHAVLFSDTTMEFHCVADVPNEDAAFVFAVGEVTYVDVFGEAHKTTFCLEATPTDIPADKPKPMLPCGGGNSMN